MHILIAILARDIHTRHTQPASQPVNQPISLWKETREIRARRTMTIIIIIRRFPFVSWFIHLFSELIRFWSGLNFNLLRMSIVWFLDVSFASVSYSDYPRNSLCPHSLSTLSSINFDGTPQPLIHSPTHLQSHFVFQCLHTQRQMNSVDLFHRIPIDVPALIVTRRRYFDCNRSTSTELSFANAFAVAVISTDNYCHYFHD